MKLSIALAFVSLALSLSIPVNHENLRDSNPQQQPLVEDAGNTKPERKSAGLTINHGTIIHANKSRAGTSKASYSYTLHIEQSPDHLLEQYSDELFAIGLLLLIPITLGVVEAAERLSRSMTVEEYPERGREKQRMESLKERKEWLLKKKEREAKLKQSRSWWKWSRH